MLISAVLGQVRALAKVETPAWFGDFSWEPSGRVCTRGIQFIVGDRDPNSNQGDVHGAQVFEMTEVREEDVLLTGGSCSDRLVIENNSVVIYGVDHSKQLSNMVTIERRIFSCIVLIEE